AFLPCARGCEDRCFWISSMTRSGWMSTWSARPPNRKAMTVYSQTYFPPLRRKILKNFLAIILSFGLLGFLLIGGVFLASGFAPKLIHVNYDSIAAASHMREAWWALHHPQDLSEISVGEWVKTFEASLQFEEGNITELG